MNTATINVDGMSCQHCVMRVRKALEALSGITSMNVEVGKVSVSFDEAKVSQKDIEAAITRAGYKVKA